MQQDHVITRILKSNLVIVVTMMIAVAALIIGITSLQRTSQEATQRAKDAQTQTRQQQETFCGFVQALAAFDPSVLNPTTPTGIEIKAQLLSIEAGSKVAETRLDCPTPLLPPPLIP